MAMTKCRVCGADISDDAKTCPKCGAQDPVARTRWLKAGFGWLVIVLIGLGVWSHFSGRGGAKAECAFSNLKGASDVFLVNGEMDAGYTLSVTVKNVGKAGRVALTANLSTSEGNFQRHQDLQLSEGEVRDLKYQFTEPTLNATNVEVRMECAPGR
jgi:hypothetical protein